MFLLFLRENSLLCHSLGQLSCTDLLVSFRISSKLRSRHLASSSARLEKVTVACLRCQPCVHTLNLRHPALMWDSTVNYAEMTSSWRPSLQFNPILLGQGRVQCILASHLEKYGCHVETGTELRGFEQHKDHVACHLRNTTVDGVVTEEEVKAAYVVGADGTRGQNLWK